MAEERHEKKSPVMGYKKGGLTQVFQLAPGEKLPDGWLDKAPEGEHPNVPRKPDAPAQDHPQPPPDRQPTQPSQPVEHPDPRHTGRR